MQSEPALILGAINAALAVAVGFGLNITPQQVGLLNALAAAICAVIVRQSVWSQESHDEAITAPPKKG